jgi:hypothetical protein
MERVAQNPGALPAVKWIFDSSFHYTPSYATDVRRTFERIRREMESTSSRKLSGEKVLRLDSRKT